MRYTRFCKYVLNPKAWATSSAIGSCLLLASSASAQWLEQNVQLEAGWNSVYFEVDPSPSNADELFADVAIDAVWMRASEPIRYRMPDCPDPDNPTPDCLAPVDTQWRVWVPSSNPASIVNTLRVIRGGQAYMIQANATTMLTFTGTPSPTKTQWKSGHNLVGFHVTSNISDAPTFHTYLAPSIAHEGANVYKLSDGTWSSVVTPATDKVRAGEGYWVTAQQASEYSGPIDIDSPSLRGVDYAVSLSEHTIELENLASDPEDVTLSYVSSAAVPTSPEELPTLPGDLPLRWYDYGNGTSPDDPPQWHPLSTETWPLAQAGELGCNINLRLAFSRLGLAPALLDAEGSGSQYQGLLKITDGRGFERYLSVAGQRDLPAGLWVGFVTINQVNWATAPSAAGSDPTSLRPTASEFMFKIMIHDNGAGAIHALNEVTLMVVPGDPDEYVLVSLAADPSFVSQLEAGSLVDGEPFSRRISTAAYAFVDVDGNDVDLPLTGAFGQPEGVVTGTSTLPADHRLNPFLHSYHPDHDEAIDSQTITRTITLTFDAASSNPSPEWGSTFWTGAYREEIHGLIAQDYTDNSDLADDLIAIGGTFELHHVSGVENLNCADGLTGFGCGG